MEPTSRHFRKRDAILSYLRRSDQHPSAEMIYAQLKQEIPDLSLGTVYRNLTLFKQQGLIQSLGSINGVERFDGTVVPHVHFVCNSCGSVLDLDGFQDTNALCRLASAKAGVPVSQCKLTFFGTCPACSRIHSRLSSQA